jgi:putative transposase
METSDFSRHQMLRVVVRVEARVLVPDLCRERGITFATFYKLRTKCEGKRR